MNRYPDLGLRILLPPSRARERSVAVEACSPLQWRNRPRFSRGSQTFTCVSKRALAFAATRLFQRAVRLLNPRSTFRKKILVNIFLCIGGNLVNVNNR